MVVANQVGSVSVLLGNGDGTLEAPTSTSVNPYPLSIATGDFNRDGKLDVAVAAHGVLPGDTISAGEGAVVVLLGKGDGTFQTPAPLPGSGLRPQSIAAADFNGDGKLDLAVVMDTNVLGQAATLAVYLGQGGGTFAAPGTFTLHTTIRSYLAIGDLNGDGKLDIAVADGTTLKADILLGDGAGGFTATATLPTTDFGSGAFVITDLDGDGKLDLVFTECCGESEGYFLRGNGDGTFQPLQYFSTGASTTAIAVTRFSGSLGPDLLMAQQGGSWIAFVNGRAAVPSPTISSPASGTTLPAGAATFSWSAVSGATKVQAGNRQHGGGGRSVLAGNHCDVVGCLRSAQRRAHPLRAGVRLRWNLQRSGGDYLQSQSDGDAASFCTHHSVPRFRHSQRRRNVRRTCDSGRHGSRFPDPAERLRDSRERRRLLTEYDGGSARHAVLPERVSDRRRSAAGFDAQLLRRAHQSERRHRPLGNERSDHGIRDQHYRRDYRHQRVLRPGQRRRQSRVLSGFAMPRIRYAECSGLLGRSHDRGLPIRSFPVPQSACGIPPCAAAYSLNATVVPQGSLGYLTLWPAGQSQPFVSTLNSPTGAVIANAAIVPAGNGGVSVYVTNTSDVILDINGYFAPPGGTGALSFYTATPCRVADTRNTQSLGGNQSRSFNVVASGCGIPASAQAFSLNATVVPPGSLAYLTLWPAGAAQPFVSTLNALDGSVTANAAMVPANGSGAVSAFVTNLTDLILDINGYFAP